MKKTLLITLIIVLSAFISACSNEAEKEPPAPSVSAEETTDITGDTEISDDVSESTINEDFKILLGDLVNITQPGTSGTSLKAVSAANKLVLWLNENPLDENTIKSTVEKFLSEAENKEEIVEAYDNIKYVFSSLKKDDANDFLTSAGFSTDDFSDTDNVSTELDLIFEFFN